MFHSNFLLRIYKHFFIKKNILFLYKCKAQNKLFYYYFFTVLKMYAKYAQYLYIAHILKKEQPVGKSLRTSRIQYYQ
ncbi:hypothetical protein ADH76_09625 [Enterocloster clostridioformis]|nr:hypothetical protein A4V08_24980 [Lachnoclostridium sp. YL32]OXE68718.1 hypothetical protein ADH76_09625 [Enterocloster clostridioformis]